MTIPILRQEQPSDHRRNWYERYRGLQGFYDRRIARELIAAAGSAEAIVGHLEYKDNISSKVNKYQLNLVRREMYELLQYLFVGRTAPIIAGGKLDAVEAAVRAGLHDDRQVMRLLYPNAKARKAAEDAQIAKARRNIDSMIVRILRTAKPLSQRVYKTRDLSKGYVDRIINTGLATGTPATEIAKRVRSSIRPDVPGGVSYAAMRLARTEINNAYHAQTISDIQEKEWVESVEWNLSRVHKPDPGDLCEMYAERGTFPKFAVPEKPHPNCRCYITPVTMDWEEFEASLLAEVNRKSA